MVDVYHPNRVVNNRDPNRVINNRDLNRVVIPDTVWELGKVTYAHGWMCMCVEFRDEILLRGEECETPENPYFLRKGKMVISVKI